MSENIFNGQLSLWQNLVRYRYTGTTMKFCPECASALQHKLIDGVVRHVCEQTDCQFVYWNNPVPVVAALVRHEGCYILACNAQWPEQQFSVITGYLEHAEAPEQAVEREVREELGLKTLSIRQIGNYAFYEKNQIILAYEAVATGQIQINHELSATLSLSAKELLIYDFGPLQLTRRIIQDWQKSRDYSIGISR